MQDYPAPMTHSPAWMFFVKCSFIVALAAMTVGLVMLPADLSIKGYFAMGTLFVTASTFVLAKTVRDEFEARRVTEQLVEARTNKMLRELDPV